ncbi:MAG: hypothetical protein ACXAEU_06695 [Candidatus Hodarchaeales archaeon]|jgi:hypothetical protein
MGSVSSNLRSVTRKVRNVKLSQVITATFAAVFFITAVTLSSMFMLAVPYYIETETSMNKIEIIFDGVKVYFEDNDPVRLQLFFRVYNPSPYYKLTFQQFKFDFISLNNIQLFYISKFVYINQEIQPLTNATVSVVQEGKNIQGDDIDLIMGAREDNTWTWKLGNEYQQLRAWYSMNYRSQERRIVLTAQNTEIVDLEPVG